MAQHQSGWRQEDWRGLLAASLDKNSQETLPQQQEAGAWSRMTLDAHLTEACTDTLICTDNTHTYTQTTYTLAYKQTTHIQTTHTHTHTTHTETTHTQHTQHTQNTHRQHIHNHIHTLTCTHNTHTYSHVYTTHTQ